jgi:hypothetical protein
MAGFEIDSSAHPYDPRNPPPRPFWVSLIAALHWAGFGLLVLLLYGVPIALVIGLLLLL